MVVPTQQKALVVPEVRAPFEVTAFEVPKPVAGEVLVRVEAAALNPIE